MQKMRRCWRGEREKSNWEGRGRMNNSSIKILSDYFFARMNYSMRQWVYSSPLTETQRKATEMYYSLLTYTFKGCQAGHCAFALMTVKTSSLCKKRKQESDWDNFTTRVIWFTEKKVRGTKSNCASKFCLWEMCFVLFAIWAPGPLSCTGFIEKPLWMQEARAASKAVWSWHSLLFSRN